MSQFVSQNGVLMILRSMPRRMREGLTQADKHNLDIILDNDLSSPSNPTYKDRGDTLGHRWQNILSEIFLDEKAELSSLDYKGAAFKIEDGKFCQSVCLEDRKSLNELVTRLAASNIDYAVSESWQASDQSQPYGMPRIPGKYYKTITINPVQENFIENLASALVEKRLKEAEAKGEVQGDASRKNVKEAISKQVEQDLWGSLPKERSVA